MTGGSESNFGSGGAAPAPTDGSDDERTSLGDGDHQLDASAEQTAPDDEESVDAALDEPILPHTKPFRAWGAAQERDTGPSIWARFRSWLGGLFRRAPKDLVSDESAGTPSTISGEYGAPSGGARPSFDDLDAPWGESYQIEERIARRQSAERPSLEDFEAPWDGSHEADSEPITGEFSPSASATIPPAVDPPREAPFVAPNVSEQFPVTDGAPDPLWDEPRVAEASSAPSEAIASSDLENVWSPPVEEEFEDVALAPEPKQGFFARLFGRKRRESPGVAVPDDANAADWASTDGEASPLEVPDSEREPAVADFADDVESAQPPMVDDFAADREVTGGIPSTAAPSTEHSAEDAASLASLLGPISVAEPEAEPEFETALEAEAEVEAEPDVVAEVEADAPIDDEPAVLDDTLDLGLALEPLPDVEALPDPEPKKPGFFSQLLRRVSRSQFVPKEPAPVLEPESIAARVDVVDMVEVVEEVTIVEAVEGIDVVEELTLVESVAETEAEAEHVADTDAASPWARPAEAPVVEEEPEPAAAVEPVAAMADPDSTQPFPAFRDARDDFRAAATPEIVDSARPTEAVEIPAFDENEKTDEFEVVPEPGDAAAVEAVAAPGWFGRLLGRKGVAAEGAAATPQTIAEDPEGKAPFVLAKFRMFYNEVIRDKHQKSDVISGFATAIVSAAAADLADPEFAAQLLSKRLSEMLELQAAESNWTGGDAVKYYPEAQYAMVALADETFATFDWPGRPSWHKYMLEPKMYGSRGAGVEFFTRVDKLLRDPDPPKGARDLARLYLLVIASGFRGKFLVPGLKRPLAEYRRRLYEFSHRADPLELYARDRKVFAEAASHTLASRAIGRFTSAQKWIATVVVLAVVYLGLSHFAWTKLSADLKDVMSRIEAPTAGTGAR